MAHQVFSDEVSTVDEVASTMSKYESQINRRMHKKVKLTKPHYGKTQGGRKPHKLKRKIRS